ncbi:MAG: cation diffusion facilitator family transporter [Cyanobacteriota bacterium]|jgi:cation diffusion facilitator family transporter
MAPASPRPYTLLSVAAALATIGLKTLAYRLTGSVGLLSDALESGVNLVAALVAFWALTLAARPADADHHYGYSKAEYFSSGLESALIVVAATAILATAGERLLHPQPLDRVDWGVALSLLATLINGGVARVLLRAGHRLDSITLRADAHHLLTDVWTSLGVVVGVSLAKVTGLSQLDPLIAILVALQIIFTGWRLLRETASGLLDRALPPDDLALLNRLLEAHSGEGVAFHALRTRLAGSRRFVSCHVLVPGEWTVQRGHDFCERIEAEISAALPRCHPFTHLEPIEDPRSWDDERFRWEGPRE